jgi:hypothetical protein
VQEKEEAAMTPKQLLLLVVLRLADVKEAVVAAHASFLSNWDEESCKNQTAAQAENILLLPKSGCRGRNPPRHSLQNGRLLQKTQINEKDNRPSVAVNAQQKTRMTQW